MYFVMYGTCIKKPASSQGRKLSADEAKPQFHIPIIPYSMFHNIPSSSNPQKKPCHLPFPFSSPARSKKESLIKNSQPPHVGVKQSS